jgi:hypothetical protein
MSDELLHQIDIFSNNDDIIEFDVNLSPLLKLDIISLAKLSNKYTIMWVDLSEIDKKKSYKYNKFANLINSICDIKDMHILIN